MAKAERERQQPYWIIAFEYDNSDVALRVFETILNTTLVEENLDASTFRFVFDDRSYVAVVSDVQLSENKQNKVKSLMSSEGVQAILPDDVIGHLHERRLAFKTTGLDYLERRS